MIARLVTVLAGTCVLLTATKKQQAPEEIIEKRDPALAVSVFYPRKSHEVKSRWRLAVHRLKLTPYASQTFDRNKTAIGLQLTVSTTFSTFTLASIAVVADGRTLNSPENLNWALGTSFGGDTEQTSVEGVDLVRGIADAKEAYITVLFPDQQAPFDRISFKLSPEQQADSHQIVAKYEELIASSRK